MVVPVDTPKTKPTPSGLAWHFSKTRGQICPCTTRPYLYSFSKPPAHHSLPALSFFSYEKLVLKEDSTQCIHTDVEVTDHGFTSLPPNRRHKRTDENLYDGVLGDRKSMDEVFSKMLFLKAE